MRYSLTLGMLLVALVICPVMARAEVSPAPGTPEARKQIEDLTALVTKLQGQIRELLQVQNVAATPIPSTLIAPNGTLITKPRICDRLDRYINLSRGMETDEVTEMQEFLKEQGYFNAEPTGFFGAKTEAALKAYQTAQGLPPAGVFGPRTRTLILAIHCTSTSTPATTSSPESQQTETTSTE